jgi:hypothetical protein
MFTGPTPVVGEVTEVHSTAKNPVGIRTTDHLGNEFIYLPGVASLVATDFVVFDEAFATTRLIAGVEGQVAVAMAAVVADKYGWFQTVGSAQGNAGDVADNAAVYATATAGRVDDAIVDGDRIYGCVTRSEETSNVATFQLNRPFIDSSLNVLT